MGRVTDKGGCFRGVDKTSGDEEGEAAGGGDGAAEERSGEEKGGWGERGLRDLLFGILRIMLVKAPNQGREGGGVYFCSLHSL